VEQGRVIIKLFIKKKGKNKAPLIFSFLFFWKAPLLFSFSPLPPQLVEVEQGRRPKIEGKPASLRITIEGLIVKWLRHNVFIITYEGSNPSEANKFI
jgi:hypothetical protein